MSGDTLVVAVPRGGGVEERRVSFASIRAPRAAPPKAGGASARDGPAASNPYFAYEVRDVPPGLVTGSGVQSFTRFVEW